MKFNVRPKSPGPGSRGPTSPTSPLHPRLHALSVDSPTGRQEDGRSQCHPLPLPPGSPTSPSSLPNTRANGQLENTTSNHQCKWKKGKLLGRGTFGHVYLGFNRYWIFFSFPLKEIYYRFTFGVRCKQFYIMYNFHSLNIIRQNLYFFFFVWWL